MWLQYRPRQQLSYLRYDFPQFLQALPDDTSIRPQPLPYRLKKKGKAIPVTGREGP
jgi:hypothetical protein